MTAAKEFWILTGPNGAGKSTLAPRFCKEFEQEHGHNIYYFNPDEIAKQTARDVFESVLPTFYNYTVHELRREGRSVMIEVSKPGLGLIRLIDQFKRDDYKIGLNAVTVATPDIAYANVKRRVAAGGHYIPEEWFENLYTMGRDFLPRVMEASDEVRVFDNSDDRFVKIVTRKDHDFYLVHVPAADVSEAKNPYMHHVLSAVSSQRPVLVVPTSNPAPASKTELDRR